jgi:hypothetical protein
MFLALTNAVAWAQELPTVSPIPEPALSQLKDFESRVNAAVENAEVANIKALYQTNGVTAGDLNSEIIRWKSLDRQDGKKLLFYFKEISELPPESRRFWSSEAHRLTQHEVTHFALVSSGSGVQLILPLVLTDGRLLIVPSEKIAAKAIEPGGAANGSLPIRSETNSTPTAAGSRR